MSRAAGPWPGGSGPPRGLGQADSPLGTARPAPVRLGGWCPRPCRTEGTGASQGCLRPPQGQRPEASCGSEAPGLPRGSCSLGGNSRRTGHLVQAGCAPFSVNLLSGSACFHGDLTSEIFHLGCQMPVDEAKPPRVTKYRHDPTGSGAGPAVGSGWESGHPRRLAWGPLQAASLGPVLPVDRSRAGWPCVHPCFSPHSGAGRVRGVPRQAVAQGCLSAARGGGCLNLGGTPCSSLTMCSRRHSLRNGA